MSSLHIEAKAGDIAEAVLLPGDPLRAQYIAEHYLEDAVCYNRVRGMLGFTGMYKGKRVSVQGSGMGMGSLGIYVNELIASYGVQRIIRVGTCGAIQPQFRLGQVIIAMSASGDSDANFHYFKGMQYAATADFELLYQAVAVAKRLGIATTQGSVFSTNTFYDTEPNRWDIWAKHGILGVEMESQMLFTLAHRLGARALAILTVSDNIITGAAAGQQEREQSYQDMMRIALETVAG